MGLKVFHNPVLLGRPHPAVQNPDANRFRKRAFEFLCVGCHILQLRRLSFFHQRTDHVNLPPLSDLFFNKFIGRISIRCVYHTIFDGQSVRRHFIQNGYMEITIQNNGKRPGNGRGAHNKHMYVFFVFRQTSLFCKALPLSDPESVLFVSNDKSQTPVSNFLLNQRMSTDHNVRLSTLYPGVDFSSVPGAD